MANPTIVAASLDDKELKQSIANLVAHVKRGLHTMLTDTNSTVNEMEKKLKSLGNLKIDSSGSADGGASKRTSKLKEEENQTKANTQAIKENTAAKKENLTFDQRQKGLQTAMGVKSARDSFYAFAQGYKKQAQEIAQYIQAFESGLNRVIQNRLNELNAQLSASKEKIRKLNEELNRRNFASGNPQAQAQVQAQLDKELKTHNQIQKAIANVNNEYAFEKTYLASLYAEHHRISNMMREETSATQQQTQAQQQLTQGAKEYSEQVKRIAAEIRESAQWQKSDKFGFKRGMMNLDGRAYPVTENLEMGLRLEDQIVSILQRANDERQKGLQITQQQAQSSRQVSEEDRKAMEAIGWADSQQKRKYTPPMMNIERISEARGALQSITGMQEAWVDSINKTKSSYYQLSDYVKQLKNELIHLPKGVHDEAAKVLIREIQQAEREMQKFQKTMSRPVSLKDALGGSEKTLDDIAYKMQRLSSYKQGIDLTKPNAANEIKQVDEALARLQKDADKWMSKSQNLIKNNTALGRSWNYMKNRLAFYLTVSAGMTLVRDLARVRSEYEMNEKALGTLLNSAERGTRIFNELSNMALVSPYTLIELSSAAKQLTAYDIAAKDVVDTTRRLADISAAVGIPVERLTYALGQVKAYGHLTSQDARQFLNAGVPLVKELANRYSELEGRLVSTADIYDRMKKHAISYNDVLSVLTSMTDEGGRFFDYQAKMAETLKVRLANLTLAYNNMLNDMGKANGGAFTTGIKGLTALLKHWREIERILGTVVVGVGAYRAATFLAGITTATAVGKNAFGAWVSLARGVKSAKDATALFSLTIKSIPFAGWATAIASLLSYFVLFNNSSDETKQKLQDIASAFEGIRKETTDLFADAISTDSIGTQLTKLKDMLELAETELGITIPVNLEDVNESNVKQKLREAKNTIDNYINFSQTFSEAAVDTKFNESMADFGTTARSTYTSVTESIKTVKVALQELVDTGKASRRDIEILKELDNKPKEGESRIEYFQRLVSLYEELGLIGKKKVEPMISHNFFKAYFSSTWDNMEELEQNQEKNLERLGIKNKTVFETMLSDVQGYYSKSSIAAYQFERQIERVAKSINLENIPISERTAKLEVAINQEAAKNNWNEFAIQYAKWVANQKFGLNITISEESKKDSEIELSDWQKRMQSWADKHGITFSLNFIEKEDEKTYADRMLQAAKDAKDKLDVLRRKLKVGTGSQTDVDKATKDYNNARLLALQAGADLSSLDNKSASSRKAASKAESELAKALKDELSTIDKVRSIYKDLTKEGMSHANAVERATRGWDETVKAINKVLTKNGLQKLDLSKFAGIENPRELVNMLQSQLNTLLKRGAKPAEIKELQTKVNTLEVDADKYDLTKITKGLNSELDKLKDEYELAVELDANPEMGNMFTEMFGLNTTDFPRTIGDYMNRVQKEFDDARKGLQLTAPLNIFKASPEQWYKWGEAVGYSKEQVDNFKKSFDGAVGVAKKWAQDTVKQTQDLQYKLADNNGKIAIEYEKLANLRQRLEKETNEQQKKLLDLQIQDQQNAIAKLKEEILQLLPTYQRLFGEVAEHSAWMTRKLAKDYKNMLVEGKNRGLNPDNTYSVRDPITGQIARITKDRMGKELKNADKELQKTQSTVKKITEAFKKGEDGVVDWVHGVELVGEELDKLGQFVDVVGNIVDAFGNPNEYNETAEAIHDIAASLQGVSTAAQGIGQIASGDYIGGAVSMASGLFSAISSWFDNSDKKIVAKIKDSEREVKRLENSYKNLEYAIEQAYGMAEYGARRAAVANRQLQLVELQRQLRLEQSRDSKHRDEDRILELKGQIVDLRNEISQSVDDITNDLLGISSIGDAAEQLVSSMIEAFKQGEDYMLQYDESFEKMIDNMIMKAIVSRVVGDRIEQMWNQVKAVAEQRGAGDQKRIEELTKKLSDAQDKAMNAQSSYEQSLNGGWAQFITAERKKGLDAANKELERIKAQLAQAEKDYAKAIAPRKEDIESMRDMAAGWREDVKNEFEYWMGAFGIGFGEGADNKQLSSLQQGIQSVTEETASAVEAYLNGMSQQAYLRNDLLTQIRDAVVGFDMDVQIGTLSEILLQLQASYQVQMSIQGILEGWATPSGQAVRVELVS